jgi:threonyl-tRNA synthetase
MNHDDHRAIGNRLDLFHQQEEGPGVVFWHPRGATIYRLLEDYIRRHMRALGYREVLSPQLLDRELWQRSGHWQLFGDNMFAVADGERVLALKPMSCPGHIQIFNKRVRSYRDLPMRLCEFGACHRNEPSGALQGLMRTRAFTQDDAHVFCARDQAGDEIARFCRLLVSIYRDLGFTDFAVGFSTRPERRAGSEETWDWAEATLEAAARSAGLEPRRQPGEGAFYGPKLEFILRDAHGRDWQCGTVQLDAVLPERLDASFIDAGNRPVRPVLVHHAVFGSLERFIALLLEHYDGRLPPWLAPDQVAVAPVGHPQADHARAIAERLEAAGLRVVVDDRAETLSRRLVAAHEQGIPWFVTVGAREARDGSLTVRERGGAQTTLSVAGTIAEFRAAARMA